MAATDSPSLSGASAIGRYFTVVSLVPSSVFVAYFVLLARSGAWGHGEIRFSYAIGNLNLRDLAVFSIGSLLVAMALHPLQFALIQLFEGFWGSSRLARQLTLWNVIRHRARAASLRRGALNKTRDSQSQSSDAMPSAARQNASREAISDWIASTELWRQYGSYPHQFHDVMPTQLGNVLRRYEALAGRHYGLNGIATVPRIMQVADPRDVAYVHNQRMQMELALRTSTLALGATALTLAFMWQHGLWLLLALAPYAVAYSTYRGAVVVAHEYGTALVVLIDLNRFALYDRMHLPTPEDIEEERENNRLLTNILRLDGVQVMKRLQEAYLDYVNTATDDSRVQATPSNAPEQSRASDANLADKDDEPKDVA